MGNGMKKEQLNLLLEKWRFYFKGLMDNLHVDKIPPASLVDLALTNPACEMLCSNMKDAFVYANLAIESIKNNEDTFLKYNSKKDTIYKLSFKDAMSQLNNS